MIKNLDKANYLFCTRYNPEISVDNIVPVEEFEIGENMKDNKYAMTSIYITTAEKGTRLLCDGDQEYINAIENGTKVQFNIVCGNGDPISFDGYIMSDTFSGRTVIGVDPSGWLDESPFPEALNRYEEEEEPYEEATDEEYQDYVNYWTPQVIFDAFGNASSKEIAITDTHQMKTMYLDKIRNLINKRAQASYDFMKDKFNDYTYKGEDHHIFQAIINGFNK